MLTHQRRSELRARISVGREPEIGEGAISVPVDDDLRHFAAADFVQLRSLRTHPPEIHPARPPSPTQSAKYEDALGVQLEYRAARRRQPCSAVCDPSCRKTRRPERPQYFDRTFAHEGE